MAEQHPNDGAFYVAVVRPTTTTCTRAQVRDVAYRVIDASRLMMEKAR